MLILQVHVRAFFTSCKNLLKTHKMKFEKTFILRQAVVPKSSLIFAFSWPRNQIKFWKSHQISHRKNHQYFRQGYFLRLCFYRKIIKWLSILILKCADLLFFLQKQQSIIFEEGTSFSEFYSNSKKLWLIQRLIKAGNIKTL